MVQGTLGLIALFSLFIKWYCEKPRRLLKVWSLDVLKQGIAAVIAHFLNILFATILSNSTSDTATDQCAWYFINYGEAKIQHLTQPPRAKGRHPWLRPYVYARMPVHLSPSVCHPQCSGLPGLVRLNSHTPPMFVPSECPQYSLPVRSSPGPVQCPVPVTSSACHLQ